MWVSIDLDSERLNVTAPHAEKRDEGLVVPRLNLSPIADEEERTKGSSWECIELDSERGKMGGGGGVVLPGIVPHVELADAVEKYTKDGDDRAEEKENGRPLSVPSLKLDGISKKSTKHGGEKDIKLPGIAQTLPKVGVCEKCTRVGKEKKAAEENIPR